MILRPFAASSCAVLLLALVASPAAAAVIEVGPADDLQAAINGAQPGDEVVLADGMYEVTARLGISIAGTEGQPIVIRAADGASPHIHRPNADQNIVDLDSVAWVEIRGIEFSGGSAGIRIVAADHLTIADCEIHDTGDVALRANDGGSLYQSLHIVGNEIHHTNDTGEGMYLGCNSNACQVADSIIERNWVHHTNQASVVQGDGIELKEGSYGNVIRDNVIHDTNYPCILTYSAVGNGAANVIERNVLWNCGDHGIQSAADATIRNNIILSAGSDGIAMQQHQSGAPQNLTVVHNTIIKATNDAISLRDAVGSVTIANNAVYAQGGDAIFFGGGDLSGLVLAGNVGLGGVAGGPGGGYVDGDPTLDFLDAHFDGAPPIDVFPAPGGALVGAGDPAHVPDDDFNTTPRGGVADVGAYLFDPDGNPGWPLAPEFKGFPSGGGDTDGSTGDSGTDEGGPMDSSGSPGPGDDATGSGGGNEGGIDTDGATGGSGGTAGSGDGEGGGCGCRSPSPRPPAGPTMMLLLLGLAARRRRR